jgi:hypothetical protein
MGPKLFDHCSELDKTTRCVDHSIVNKTVLCAPLDSETFEGNDVNIERLIY